MVVNEHTSLWRRFRRRESPVEAVADGPKPEEGRVEPDDRRRIWLACQALPDSQRTAVVLRYYEQLEYAEIAALTGVQEGSVRARVSRGIAALRAELGEELS
jgi:RNA polymerase sigma factor (sigma-70 family)